MKTYSTLAKITASIIKRSLGGLLATGLMFAASGPVFAGGNGMGSSCRCSADDPERHSGRAWTAGRFEPIRRSVRATKLPGWPWDASNQ